MKKSTYRAMIGTSNGTYYLYFQFNGTLISLRYLGNHLTSSDLITPLNRFGHLISQPLGMINRTPKVLNMKIWLEYKIHESVRDVKWCKIAKIN